jgi:hypothetical protein
MRPPSPRRRWTQIGDMCARWRPIGPALRARPLLAAPGLVLNARLAGAGSYRRDVRPNVNLTTCFCGRQRSGSGSSLAAKALRGATARGAASRTS